MNRFGLILAMIFLLFSACEAQDKSKIYNWKEFISDEVGFKATFPAIPIKTVSAIDGIDKKGQVTKFVANFTAPDIYFGVWYADFPQAPVMNQDALKANYDFVRDGLLKLLNSKLISERDVWVNEKLGRELILRVKNQIAKYRIYLIGKRNFQLITTTNFPLTEGSEIDKSMDKFLDSFQLIEK